MMKNTRFTLKMLAALLCALALPATAQAGWTYFSVPSHASSHVQWARACKRYENGGYGPVWKVTFQVQRKTGTIIGIHADVLRYNNATSSTYVSRKSNHQWLYGVVSGLDTYASAYYRDNIQLRVLMPDRGHAYVYGGNFRGASPTNLATC